jgi:glyoxylase-like metal-dependent hydrolase (beta-lactamase superfamily II)
VLTCHLLDTGHCLAFEPLVLQGGRWRHIECHSLVALLGHPRHGWTLWDAGYAPRLLDATRRLPFRIYRWATPLRIKPELAVVAQLPRFGLTPADVRRVIVSHFHADHVAGLIDFPHAEIIALREAYEGVAGLSGFAALRKAFVPALLPADFERRAVLLGPPSGADLGMLGPTIDLFGDGSALVVSLPGHARGQIGLLAQTERGPLFFLADACWLTEGARRGRLPNRITNVIADDGLIAARTVRAIAAFARSRPDLELIPTHCPEAFARHVRPVALHPPRPA